MFSHAKLERPKRVLPAPVNRGNFDWTAKLVMRDLKNMRDKPKTQHLGKRAKLSAMFKNAFKSAKHAADAASSDIALSPTAKPITSTSKSDIDADKRNSNRATALKAKKKESQHIQKVSITTIETGQATVFTTRPHTGDTHITEPHEHYEAPPIPTAKVPSVFEDRNIYHLLSAQLDEWYKTRPFAPSHEQRWKTRGMCLFLYLVIQMCPFNPFYNQIREIMPDHDAFLQHLLQLGSLNGSDPNLQELGLDSVIRISNMPSDLYSHMVANATRVDSHQTTLPQPIWPATRKHNGALYNVKPTPTELWAGILIAVQYPGKTAEIVKSLLHEIMPKLDVDAFLLRIGDPAIRLKDEEGKMLCEKLQPLLYPDFERHIKYRSEP